jgi:hypothetical protein
MLEYIKESEWYVFYFLPFLLINLMILNMLPIALLLTTFKQTKREILWKERIKAKESLITSFICLVGSNGGNNSNNGNNNNNSNNNNAGRYLERYEFCKLMESVYKNNENKVKISAELFSTLDTDEQSKLSLKQFISILPLI